VRGPEEDGDEDEVEEAAPPAAPRDGEGEEDDRSCRPSAEAAIRSTSSAKGSDGPPSSGSVAAI
jgi:hypothetical protein